MKVIFQRDILGITLGMFTQKYANGWSCSVGFGAFELTVESLPNTVMVQVGDLRKPYPTLSVNINRAG